ncbi:hypothetical protein NDI44_21905 [Trichocoleus sp. DQ-A3]|uniref:hypothetical protein n=1 Tax=Coleofasciculus sp. FACHB-125 TaxID=2692784 RepID=UPI0016850711|nr:hypothetical protein [Coleofasciculus sp. FACHB-125]MBD1898603.1 hypothetical protein [Coleofasciculus sp. FACHB-125]
MILGRGKNRVATMHESGSDGLKVLSAIEFQGRGWSQRTANLMKSFAHKRIAPISLVTLLGCGGATWLATAAFIPQIAQAYTARSEVALVRQPAETYEGFVRRAEVVARAAAQRSFDRDILVTDVAVMILGQNQGAIAPILSLKVTRGAWRSRPDTPRWATYFPNTKSLLGFVDDVTPSDQPVPATAEPPPAPAQGAPATPPPPTAVPGNIRDVAPGAPTGTPQNQTPGTAAPAAPGTPQNQAPGTAAPTAPNAPTAPTSPTIPSSPAFPGGNVNPTETIPNPTENIPNPTENIPNPTTPTTGTGTTGQGR